MNATVLNRGPACYLLGKLLTEIADRYDLIILDDDEVPDWWHYNEEEKRVHIALDEKELGVNAYICCMYLGDDDVDDDDNDVIYYEFTSTTDGSTVVFAGYDDMKANMKTKLIQNDWDD
tara:strand:- start:1191 stop:1547 length:357 start_codon:yes stop_codon:yes gene_type:complete